jgi:capsular polysaccharide export protein
MKKNSIDIVRQVKMYWVEQLKRVWIRYTSSQQVVNRQRLNDIFKLRDKIFFRRKKPESETYPFSIVDPFELFGEDHPYGDFNLVGEDWRDQDSKKPVAILWGFNNWKWGFVKAYLPEYRTAFAPRKILSLPSLLAIRRFPIAPSVVIFWGYTEPWLVRWYAEMKNIKILRMEDGFIRSSSLGASHSTPYSLVLDDVGLHYNPNGPSAIENILNHHQFTESELATANECLKLMIDLRLSKYNPAALDKEHLGTIKIRKRVAVLGQVDNDMSIRLGNPDGWTMTELIRLAKIENPDAEILYRPHPDIYKGFQRSRFRLRSVEKFCQISTPDIPLVDFLDTVDHVYTITSLSGFEALLRGKKVTVVGAAFYAGWGVTDDRMSFPSRRRKCTLPELFFGIYLKYPRYLANINDSEIGFRAACFRIKADIEIDCFDLFCSNLSYADQKFADVVSKSNFWPRVVFDKKIEGSGVFSKIKLEQIDFDTLLTPKTGRMFQIAIAYALCGACADDFQRNDFLNKIRACLDFDIFNSLLIDLGRCYQGEYISKQFSWLLAEVGEDARSLDILNKAYLSSCEKIKRNLSEDAERAGLLEENTAVAPNIIEMPRLSKIQADILLDVFERNVSLRNIDAAIDVAKYLMLEGYFVQRLIQKIAQLSVIKFDRVSARYIANFSQRIDLYDQNRISILIEANNFTECCVENSPLEFIVTLVKLITLKPDRIGDAVFLAKKYSKYCDDKLLEKIFCGILLLDNEQSIRKSAGFIAIEQPAQAVHIVENLISNGDSTEAVRIAYSIALSYSGRLEDAIFVMDKARLLKATSANYRESLRLCVLVGDYEKGYRLLREAQIRKIDLGDMHPRKIYFGSRMVKEAFETFTQLSLKNTIEKYYKEKYYYIENIAHKDDKLFMLAIFGPGDEIRFASVYNLLPKRLVQQNLSIACSPRLKTLFERSFPGIKFIPVERPRNSDLINQSNYSNVLGSDLTGVIDNTATAAINDADHIMLVTDMLHECLPAYESFPGVAYLKEDELLMNRYNSVLPKNIKRVGLSWRSSLTTHSRNEHYLTVEELEPIFSIQGIQYVNFQYDDCQEELDWIEARYPGKIINISEIDHYNDFESVAALMKCMDLLIAPAITVVELAGALGCKTWLLSNSSELFWRKIDSSGTDVWHNNTTHIEGDILGDKNSLVDKLTNKLRNWVCE